MKDRFKYIVAAIAAGIFMGATYEFPAEVFITFTVGWLFIIPAAVVIYMVRGYIAQRNETKHQIVVTLAPTAAMKDIVRREADIRRDKELIFEKMKN